MMAVALFHSHIELNESLFHPPSRVIPMESMEPQENHWKDPALGALLQLPSPTNSDDEAPTDDPITEKIRPLLYRMYVAAHILKLGTEARYSALVLLHRYVHAVHRLHGKLQRPTRWVAAACIFLATKSEEEPRRLRDMINLAHMVLADNEDKKYDSTIINMDKEPPSLDEGYWDTKKKIIETEQAVLRWLGFDAFVPHPHRAVALMLQHLPPGKQELLAPIVDRRLNDGLFHGPALRHGMLELATAAIELAQQELGESMLPHMDQGWWKRYGVSDEDIRKATKHLQEATDLLKRICVGKE
jgi:hypothetical protein